MAGTSAMPVVSAIRSMGSTETVFRKKRLADVSPVKFLCQCPIVNNLPLEKLLKLALVKHISNIFWRKVFIIL